MAFAVFPQLRADLTPVWPAQFFVVLNHLPPRKGGGFRFRDLPPPVTGTVLRTHGRHSVVPTELLHPTASLRELETALSPERALIGSYPGRAVRLGNVRQRVDRGTILQRLEESFGVHGIAARTTSRPPLEPIIKLPRCVRRSARSHADVGERVRSAARR